jgi:hypothetical protein
MDLLSKWMGEDLEIFPVPVFDSKGKWWGGIGVLRMVSKERKEELKVWWKRRGFRYMKAVGSEEWCLERCKGREYAKRAFELGRYEHRGVCFAT